jgi:hypothetical protein
VNLTVNGNVSELIGGLAKRKKEIVVERKKKTFSFSRHK